MVGTIGHVGRGALGVLHMQALQHVLTATANRTAVAQEPLSEVQMKQWRELGNLPIPMTEAELVDKKKRQERAARTQPTQVLTGKAQRKQEKKLRRESRGVTS
jgi:hypothetical protein